MGMRVTTSMMMNTYRYNLQGSTQNLSGARNKVLTQRNFDSYAEDPASATMAWRVRRAMFNNFDYQTANSDTYSRFNIAWTTMGVVNDELSDKDGRESTIRGLTDSTAAGRKPLGQVLSNGAETIIQAMNSAKYSDHFVFSGTDEMNVPFSWSKDGELLYRGINVAAGGAKQPTQKPVWYMEATATPPNTANVPESAANMDSWEEAWFDYYKNSGPNPAQEPTGWGDPDEFGIPENMPEKPANAAEQAWVDYYNDQGDLKKLEKLAAEEENVDLGMGLQEDENGTLINGSAFNRALPGVSMLGGYGLDEDGDPRNVVLIMKRLGELCSACDAETGHWASDNDQEEANRLLNKLIDGRDRTTEAYTEIETKAHFLKENQSRLEVQGDYLQEERLNIEQVDLADAITEFTWDYYCYSAALKIGTQLLSESLLDYMR